MKFMNLAEEYCKKDSLFYVLPVEYEGNVTWLKGADKGSVEIIKASSNMEYYDEQFEVEPFLKGIHTLSPLKLKGKKPEIAMKAIANEVAKHKDKFMITFGGDHSVTIGTLKGIEENHNDFSVIVLDAHSDFFHSWNNSQFNHRCTSQRISEKHKVAMVGVRSMDVDEVDIIKKNENTHLIRSYNYKDEIFKDVLDKLEKKVYISIDVDVFDPSFIRNTGTPEPGGFDWNKVISILQTIFKNKEVVGADIVEFSPRADFDEEAYFIAKLAYKVMALSLSK